MKNGRQFVDSKDQNVSKVGFPSKDTQQRYLSEKRLFQCSQEIFTQFTAIRHF